MKYINFKRYKFSTVVKNFNTLVVKSFNKSIYNFLRFFKSLNLEIYDFKKIYRYIDIRRFDLKKITKYIKPAIYNINRIRKINFFSSKFLLLHLPASVIFFAFLYIFIPTFYNYDKSNIESAICKKHNIACLIKGKVNYSFYPTPRIKINDIIINNLSGGKGTLMSAERVIIKLSIKNLLSKERHKFEKIELNNFETNLDLQNLKQYRNIFKNKTNTIPITFSKGKIIFLDKKNYVATISDTNANIKFLDDSIQAKLKGKFLNDNIIINYNSKSIDNKSSTDIALKMSNLNLLTKASFFDSTKDKNITSGNFLIKKGKNKITGIFDYKDGELVINKSNLKNTFLVGGLNGKIIFLPYFDFNMNCNLNSINFTKLYNYFLALDEKEKSKLFKINNKINGKLNISADKIHSRHNLVKSFESRVKFYNGNVTIEQFLISLGKLGAADVLGAINNDKKLINLKFESNIFVDNQKKFLSKFGIYNKENISSNLFISGNFDLQNIRTSFYEVSGDKKFNTEDINYIESEFNDLMLEDGFTNLFDFRKFKIFLKSIADDKN